MLLPCPGFDHVSVDAHARPRVHDELAMRPRPVSPSLKSVPTLVLVSVFAALCGSGRRLLFLLRLLLPVLLVVVVLEEEQREHPQDAADADADGFALRTGSEGGGTSILVRSISIFLSEENT